jgi:hypothetical protein
MIKKTTIGLIILSIALSFLVGFGIGNFYQRNIWQAKLSQLKSEHDTLNSQLERVFPALPEEIYNVFGAVLKVGDKYLEMEAQIQVSRFPLPEGKDFEKRNLKVYITDKTEIFWLGTDPLSSSSGPIKKLLAFKDIKPGQQIFITTKEDIKTKQVVIATQIQVL